MKIAFQGELGAYSEMAVYSYFGQEVEVKPCKSFDEVFERVKTGNADYGVVPIENSIEGSVNRTYDLFLEYDLKVRGEIIIRISHCLIAHKGTDINQIKAVYSHPQALAQCRKFLEENNLKAISNFDTAGSVKMIKEENMIDSAAIASERAAQIYDMAILAREIEDVKNNSTRFFVLDKQDAPFTAEDKTSIIFAAKSIPGALHKVLKEFADRNINLTKIESRPTKQTPWEYHFYLDFEGHRTEQKCQQALESIKDKTIFIKILGSYKAAKKSNCKL
ncbi:MAG: prephenate dehydratase [Candidatus Bathyarchaeota archaeon]|nr:MAG: prephenate dehydratase [Candidatus Bathyarchaeum tardum]WNZ28815.1 MAG: prephenate dehydratase [Candidatus Bathyarchaeota archaeon]